MSWTLVKYEMRNTVYRETIHMLVSVVNEGVKLTPHQEKLPSKSPALLGLNILDNIEGGVEDSHTDSFELFFIWGMRTPCTIASSYTGLTTKDLLATC